MTLNDFIAERTEILDRFKRYAETLDSTQLLNDEDMSKSDWKVVFEYFLENTEE